MESGGKTSSFYKQMYFSTFKS